MHTHTHRVCVVLYIRVVEKVMTCFGHKLKISQVSVSPEDTIPVGKAVIPTALSLRQPAEVVTSSHGFWVPALAAPPPLLFVADFNPLLWRVWWVLSCYDTQRGLRHQVGSFAAVKCPGFKCNGDTVIGAGRI